MANDIASKGFIQEMWHAAVMRDYENALVASEVVWDKSGDITKGKGDTIHFTGLADVEIQTGYTGTITYNRAVDSDVTLQVDKDAYYGYEVDSIEEAMSSIDLEQSLAKDAAYRMKKQIDTALLSSAVYSKAGQTHTDDTVDTASIFSNLTEVNQWLEEADIPASDRWAIITPWVKAKMRLAGIVFSVNEGMDGRKGGYSWGEYNELKLLVSNNTVDLAGGRNNQMMAGSKRAIGFAAMWEAPRAMGYHGSFKSYISQKMVYGLKVIRPKELIRMDWTPVAETTV